MQRRAWFIAAVLLFTVGRFSWADEAPKGIEYGHLRGRFVYDGEPPKPKVALVAKGVAIVDEAFVVNPKNRGIANLGVWINLGPADPLPPIHPSYGMRVAKPDGPRTKKLTIVGNRIEPHFLLLRTDEVLAVNNAEAFACDAKFDMANNPPLVLLLPPAAEKAGAFVNAERLPSHISSAIRPWLSAKILVKDHPYFAVTDSEGNFEIRNLPAGAHEFRFWHERAGYITTVERDDVLQKWMAGKVKLTIPANETLDMGAVRIPPKAFP